MESPPTASLTEMREGSGDWRNIQHVIRTTLAGYGARLQRMEESHEEKVLLMTSKISQLEKENQGLKDTVASLRSGLERAASRTSVEALAHSLEQIREEGVSASTWRSHLTHYSSLQSRLDDVLKSKIASKDVEMAINAIHEEISSIESEMVTQADLSQVNETMATLASKKRLEDIQHGTVSTKDLKTLRTDLLSLLDLKADEAHVTECLSRKADASSFSGSIQTKASSEELLNGLAAKADRSEISNMVHQSNSFCSEMIDKLRDELKQKFTAKADVRSVNAVLSEIASDMASFSSRNQPLQVDDTRLSQLRRRCDSLEQLVEDLNRSSRSSRDKADTAEVSRLEHDLKSATTRIFSSIDDLSQRVSQMPSTVVPPTKSNIDFNNLGNQMTTFVNDVQSDLSNIKMEFSAQS